MRLRIRYRAFNKSNNKPSMNRLITILIGLLLSINITSQSCLPEGYYITTQSEIDYFQINFPGCTQIAGDLFILGFWHTYIHNLNGLNVLTSIEGSLEIDYCTALTNFEGLNNLTSIGGDLIIMTNGSLTNLSGLEGLLTIGGSLKILANGSLISLNGCNNLNFIGGDLHIVSNNDTIRNLLGLESLITIGNNVYISSNWELMNFIGLNNLDSIGGDLIIQNNHNLVSLTGLEGLTSIGGSLLIGREIGNSSLTSLTGLNNLTSIGQTLQIYYNPIVSLSGLENLTAGTINDIKICHNSLSDCEVQFLCDYLASPNGVVEIHNNASGCNSPAEIANACGIVLPCLPYGNYYFENQNEIDSFHANYPDCYDLEGNVLILGNDIENLNGLNSISSIGGALTIGDNSQNINPLLYSLSGLDSLSYIGGSLEIIRNSSLDNLSGLDNLDSIGENLKIFRNSYLKTLSGLGNLEYIGNDLSIVQSGLNSLMNLSSLNSISGGIDIQSNDSLINLMGLESLNSINTDLNINWNKSLTSLKGLDNIDPNSISNLSLHDNSLLSECEVQSICAYLANPNGTIEIHDNFIGCNSQQEIEFACEVGLSGFRIPLCNYIIYPNPASIIVSVVTTEKVKQNDLTIFNLHGQVLDHYIITEKKTIIDVSHLLPGVYIFKLTSDNSMKMFKLVKY